MLTVEIDTIAPTQKGLCFGLIIRYGQDGPVRFAQAHLPWSAIAKGDRALMVREFNRVRDEFMDTEPLF